MIEDEVKPSVSSSETLAGVTAIFSGWVCIYVGMAAMEMAER